MSKKINNKKGLSIVLALFAFFQIVIKEATFIINSKEIVLLSRFKPIINILSLTEKMLSDNVEISIIFWSIFLFFILYGVYMSEFFKFAPQYALSFINIVLSDGLSKTFFDKISKTIALNWLEILIVIVTLTIIMLIVNFWGKIRRIKKTYNPNNVITELDARYRDIKPYITEPNKSVEGNKVEKRIITADEKKPSYLYSKNHSKIFKKRKPEYSLGEKNEGEVNQGMDKKTQKIIECISTILSVVFFLAIVIIIVVFIVTPEGNNGVLFKDMLDNFLSFLNEFNIQSANVEGNTTEFLFSLGTFILIPIILLLVVLTVFFAVSVIFYCIFNITTIKQYIVDISKKTLFFFFETITSVISPFILIPDFISTVASVLFDVNVETYINQEVNRKIDGLKNSKDDNKRDS